MKRWIRVTNSNGFCGCDEEEDFEIEFETEEEFKEKSRDIGENCYNSYMTTWGEDDRFIDCNEDDYETTEEYNDAYDEAVLNYQSEFSTDWEDITEEKLKEIAEAEERARRNKTETREVFLEGQICIRYKKYINRTEEEQKKAFYDIFEEINKSIKKAFPGSTVDLEMGSVQTYSDF